MISKEELKNKLPFLTKSVWYIKRRKIELASINRHLSRKKNQKNNYQLNNGKIKVVFICQYIPAWSKNKQLYEELVSDKRFEVILLCIPNRVSANKLIDPEDMSNDTYEYFSGHNYKEAVNALIGKDEWLDLRQMHPDYVIYNRYDRAMPVPYTSDAVSTYAKICMITYGTALLKSVELMLDKHFMSNTYCLFAETEGRKKGFYRINTILSKLGLSKAVCCGVPGVENAYKAKDDESPAWSFSDNEFRAIYAPRWTTEASWGGSSFLDYKDAFLKLADLHRDMDILVRPHPLMFDHFINSGIMSEKEVQEYKDECIKRPNIKIDSEKEYLETFWNSSVLICDFSSFIIEYFVTQKPVIYLTYRDDIDYNDEMLAMLSGSYIVNNEEELFAAVDNLLKGIDPLAEKRAEIYQKVIAENDNLYASKNMKEVLVNSYNK